MPHRDAALDFSLPDTATGDAWPLVRPRSIPSPEPVAHGVERGEGIEPGRDATTHSPPAEVTMGDHAAGEALPAPGPEEMGPGLGDLGEEPESRAAGGLSFDAEFAPEEAFGGEEEALPPRHAVAPAGPGTALTGEPASGERPGPGPFAPPAPEPGLPGVGQPAPTAGAGEAAYYPPAGYPQPPVARSRTEPGVGQPVPSLSHEGEYPSEDYLADMPAPAFPPPTFPRPGVEPFGPPPTPQRAREAWVEGRPSLGAGLRKFAFPGFVLMALGAGGAYGLQTPLAAYITGGPYGQYLLASAAAVLSMGVGLWFMNGPMRPVVSRMAPGFPGVGGRAAAEAAAAMAPGRGFPAQGPPVSARPPRPAFRSVGPAPIPGRAALESGLEAPDAIDWGRLPKPSVFIPWSQAGTTIGLDIGAAWMKAVQVGPGRHGLEIVNLGLCPTPEGVVGEDGISDPDLLGEAVKDLLQSRNIIQREVVTALGGQGVIIRHVQFPVMSPDELREVLRWEAEHHIPIPPPEAVVDFTVMPGQGDSDERGNRQMRVMLVGAQKKVVEDQIAALRRAKLVPRGVDAEALACFRVVQAAGHFVEDPLRYAQAVIDLGHSSTKLGIYLRGALEMSRTLGIGGRALTQVLVEKLRVPEVEAETLKRQYGVLPEGGRVTAALSPTLQDLMFEIRRSFEFFSSRHFGQSVRHVYLIGGGARMPGIVQALGRYLNPSLGERIPEGAAIGVELVDPLSAVGLHPRLYDQADLIGTEFVTALGLALSEEEEGPAHEG
ncbi:MAG: type IV pilus assembly protein PilM [Bacillota bacterium]|nr:MAG: type IV pilus assembly protein PilM [Bacillota bacterium]